jgi:HAD superfamily hydrolase (TIGR01450 family)
MDSGVTLALPGLDLSARGYLVDLDGTLISGGRPLPWTATLLAALAGRFVIVSNDAEHTAAELAAKLAHLVRLDVSQIVLAGECAIRLLARDRPAARVLLLASASLRQLAADLGLGLTDDDPDVVLVGRDRDFSYASIARAARSLHRGADLIVANPDTSHPGPGGEPVPETGALAAAILAAAGHRSYRVIGKPEPALFEDGLVRLGCAAAEALMIGDNPATDGAGAAAAGIRFCDARLFRGDR